MFDNLMNNIAYLEKLKFEFWWLLFWALDQNWTAHISQDFENRIPIITYSKAYLAPTFISNMQVLQV